MIFEVRHEGSKYGWALRHGTDKKPGRVVCINAVFESEAAARSDIADARKAFAGTRFAKVVVR